MPSSYALRLTFTPKKASQKFSAERKMAWHPTFSLYEIDPSWVTSFMNNNELYHKNYLVNGQFNLNLKKYILNAMLFQFFRLSFSNSEIFLTESVYVWLHP